VRVRLNTTTEFLAEPAEMMLLGAYEESSLASAFALANLTDYHEPVAQTVARSSEEIKAVLPVVQATKSILEKPGSTPRKQTTTDVALESWELDILDENLVELVSGQM
jgi:hypothetical protein